MKRKMKEKKIEEIEDELCRWVKEGREEERV